MYQSTHIGNCEFYLEDGALRLYSHNFGQSSGFSARMNSEEAMKLLEWLSQHHEEISQSIHDEARQRKATTLHS